MAYDFEDLLDKEYDFDRYNCGHFVAEVWKRITGENIAGICKDFVDGNSEEYRQKIRLRKRLKSPETPCVAIMQAPNTLPHAGVYFDGRIIHLSKPGVMIEDLCILGAYYRLSFYK